MYVRAQQRIMVGTNGISVASKVCIFAKKASFKRYGVICISRQRVRSYLVFVNIQASLLVKKANEILGTRNECRRLRQQATLL